MIKSFVYPYTKHYKELASSVKKEGSFGLYRFFYIILGGLYFLTPIMLIRGISNVFGENCNKRATDFWIILKLITLFLILLLGQSIYLWAFIIAVIILSDFAIYLLSQVFIWDLNKRLKRTLLFLLLNIISTISGFSVVYLYTGSLSNNNVIVTSWHQAFYFSSVTMATVGFGDITPFNAKGRFIVVSQILFSFLYIVVVLAGYINLRYQKDNETSSN